MSNEPLQLIVGLGNPTKEYEKTRHNAGQWFVNRLLENYRQSLSLDKRFKSFIEKIPIANGQNCYFAMPTTYMNESGQSVRAVVQFYRIPLSALLIVHDELDLPVGEIRFKQGGGHGGHNGLRSVIQELGNADFYRLRIGIGRPEHAEDVTAYVLNRPTRAERLQIDEAIERAIEVMPLALAGDWQKAMTILHQSKI